MPRQTTAPAGRRKGGEMPGFAGVSGSVIAGVSEAIHVPASVPPHGCMDCHGGCAVSQ